MLWYVVLLLLAGSGLARLACLPPSGYPAGTGFDVLGLSVIRNHS